MSEPPLKHRYFLRNRVGFYPAFTPSFIPQKVGYSSPTFPVTPWFQAGLGQFLTFLTILRIVENVGVSARYCPFMPVLRGVGRGLFRDIPGYS